MKNVEVQCKHYQLVRASAEGEEKVCNSKGGKATGKQQKRTELTRKVAVCQVSSEVSKAKGKGKGKSKSRINAGPSPLKDPNAAKHLLK